jgi:hypothetical protein
MPEMSVPQDCAPIPPAPAKKRPSGAEYRRRRVAKGLPRNLPSDLRYNKKRNQKNNRGRRLKRRDDMAAYVAAIKLSRGCADCGYRAHPAALEFDHLPGFEKRMPVAMIVHRVTTRAALKAEMAKCEVVCANCHRIRTWSRKQWGPKKTPD